MTIDPLALPTDHPFGVHNLPYGVFAHEDRARVGARLGVRPRGGAVRRGLGGLPEWHDRSGF